MNVTLSLSCYYEPSLYLNVNKGKVLLHDIEIESSSGSRGHLNQASLNCKSQLGKR